MTISSTTRTAGPYVGTGLVGSYPFLFKVMNANEVAAYTVTDTTTQIKLTYGIDYSVSLNANQDSSPGGSITLLPAGTKLALGTTLSITSEAPNLQLLDLTNQGGFYPDTINDALDRATIQIQQLQTQVDRAIKSDITANLTPDQILASIAQSEADAATYATNAQTSWDQFRGTYYGALAADPTTDPLGNPVSVGDFYFNTVNQVCRAKTSTTWADVGAATPVTIRVQRFTGNGTTTVFTLNNAASFENAVEIFINGVAQVPGVDYTLSGNPLVTITFSTAPPSGGTNNIYVRITNAIAGQTVNDGAITTLKLADSSVTTEKINNNAVTPAKLAQDNALKNRIINGKMELFQRGSDGGSTTFTAAATYNYFLDRWAMSSSGAVGLTLGHESSVVPSSGEFSRSLRFTCNTAVANLASTDFTYIAQVIEGYNIRDLIARPFTLSFWVRSSVVGTHSVALQNSNADRCYIMTYTVNVANTWEYKTITFSNGLPSTGGTWNWTNGSGLKVIFTLACGNNYVNTAGGNWKTVACLGVSGTANLMATAGNSFYFTGVQLERGSNASAYDHRPIGFEQLLCNRYYATSAAANTALCSYASGAGVTTIGSISFPALLRAAPTISYGSSPTYSTNTSNLSAGAEISSAAFTSRVTAAAAGLISVSFAWYASAELT